MITAVPAFDVQREAQLLVVNRGLPTSSPLRRSGGFSAFRPNSLLVTHPNSPIIKGQTGSPDKFSSIDRRFGLPETHFSICLAFCYAEPTLRERAARILGKRGNTPSLQLFTPAIFCWGFPDFTRMKELNSPKKMSEIELKYIPKP